MFVGFLCIYWHYKMTVLSVISENLINGAIGEASWMRQSDYMSSAPMMKKAEVKG